MFKLTQDEYQNYTGELAGAQFENGVTQEDLTMNQIMRIGGNFALVKVKEDGSEFVVGPGADNPDFRAMLDEHLRSKVFEAPPLPDYSLAANESGGVSEVEIVDPVEGAKYTREQLERIADEKGLAGLREIANQHGIKGRSIVELINELLSITSK